jgi:hypothetical protein
MWYGMFLSDRVHESYPVCLLRVKNEREGLRGEGGKRPKIIRRRNKGGGRIGVRRGKGEGLKGRRCTHSLM